MSLNRRHILKAGSAGIALFAIGRPASAQATVMRFGHPHPTSDSWQVAALQFAEKVKAKSGGKLEIQVFPNGSLGSDPQMISAVRGGTLDITLTGNPFFTGMAPKLNVLDLPFLFSSRAHAAKVLDGAIGDGLRKDLEGSNLKALATWEVGWRNLTNSRRPIANANDIKGLKIRTTPNPAHVQAFRLLGAVPTPMPFTELFTALETKTVDGQENPVTLILNAKFFEVQKHLSLTRHAFTSAPLVMNKGKFDALAPDLQKVLTETAIEMAAAQRKMNEDAEGSSLEALKKAGMQAVENPDRDSFSKIVTEDVRKEFVGKFGSDVLDAIVKLA
ncbi:MAG: TRAP transporter substrate-binding protein [Beijerinckiaceae bacterium]|nr:TRAP transporter substrate-binding protein [Beijerinckiaceae bacterium]